MALTDCLDENEVIPVTPGRTPPASALRGAAPARSKVASTVIADSDEEDEDDLSGGNSNHTGRKSADDNGAHREAAHKRRKTVHYPNNPSSGEDEDDYEEGEGDMEPPPPVRPGNNQDLRMAGSNSGLKGRYKNGTRAGRDLIRCVSDPYPALHQTFTNIIAFDKKVTLPVEISIMRPDRESRTSSGGTTACDFMCRCHVF